jgi:hypothetical protein
LADVETIETTSAGFDDSTDRRERGQGAKTVFPMILLALVLTLCCCLGVAVVRDEHGRIGVGNQLARKYPKPALDDPEIRHQLAQRREEIIEQRGGRDCVAAVMLTLIDRFVVLEAFVVSWEGYFMKSSPISRQGRVRSGFTSGYLSSVAQLQRLAQQIGLERHARRTQTPAEWLEGLGDQEAPPNGDHAPDDPTLETAATEPTDR